MRQFLGIAMLTCGSAAALLGQTYTMKLVAGKLPPTTAPTQPNAIFLLVPEAVLVDAKNNTYIADTNSHKVWKIDATNQVTLVAGTGAIGTPAFGKAASGQPLNQPAGMCADAKGNVYISDRGASRIYQIDSSGVLTLVTGVNGNARFSGDGRLAKFADINDNRGCTIGPDGNLYFADRGNNRVRKVDLTTGIITTVAGSGSGFAGDGGPAIAAQLRNPEGVAFDLSGNLLITDTGNNRIRSVDKNGVINTIVGRDLTPAEVATAIKAPYTTNTNATNGQCNKPATPQTLPNCVSIGDGKDATQAILASPSQIAVDANNNIIFTDTANNRVRIVTASNNLIATLIGKGASGNGGDGGPGNAANLNSPTGLALDTTGNIFITDKGNNRVRRLDMTLGTVGSVAGASTFNGDSTALETSFNRPTGIAMDAAGNIYVADSGNNRIRKVDTANVVTTIAGTGAACSFSTTSLCGDAGDALSAGLNNPAGIWVDPTGTIIYFADAGNNRIRRIAAGTISTIAGGGTLKADGLPATQLSLNLNSGASGNTQKFPGVAADGLGAIYFTEPGNRVVRKINVDGTVTTIAGTYGVSGAAGDGGPAISALLNNPTGIVVDKAGKNVFVADTGNHTVRVISNGIIYPVAGEATSTGDDNESATNPAYTYRFRFPEGLALDKDEKNLFIADTAEQKVTRVALATLLGTRVAGNRSNTNSDFTFDYSGDNGSAAASAQLSYPTGIAVDAAGNVFFADSANNVIREAVAGK